MADDLRAWATAWQDAAFGRNGFYRRTVAEEHFATDVTDGIDVARRLIDLMAPELETIVARHGSATVTDAGAGSGLLVRQLAGLLPSSLIEQVAWRAIDIRARPDDLPAAITWFQLDIRDLGTTVSAVPGVVIAHELLDDIPCDVLEIDDDGARRVVLVDPDNGREELGPPLTSLKADGILGGAATRVDGWCDAWWPRREPAARIEVGCARDDVWRTLTDLVPDGLAIAIDYAHTRQDRDAGVWDGGTLVGYHEGRICRPVPDGRCNITAHVALDACAASAEQTGAEPAIERGRGDMWWLAQRMGR